MKNEIKDLIVNNLSLNFDQNIIIDNISFELETAGSRAMEPNSTPSQIKQAVKYMNWDAFQDDNEIIQLQDYIEEIIGQF